MESKLTSARLEALRRLDTCTVSNAIEAFNVRLRNEGFADSSISCIFPALPAMAGYAVTCRIRCSGPPPKGHSYLDRTDWWDHVQTIPVPRVVVIQDIDHYPGLGSFLGEVHVSILKALKCVGAVTNGAVRDLAAVEPTGFNLFARNVAVSHAYVHFVDFGGPVEIGGLRISPGDLIHDDRHGVLSVPKQIAAKIPGVAAKALERERRIIELCRSADFSLERLNRLIKELLKERGSEISPPDSPNSSKPNSQII
jgi:4-hydroxy-4-methyl-2-oxoglutarate aldolase